MKNGGGGSGGGSGSGSGREGIGVNLTVTVSLFPCAPASAGGFPSFIPHNFFSSQQKPLVKSTHHEASGKGIS